MRGFGFDEPLCLGKGGEKGHCRLGAGCFQLWLSVIGVAATAPRRPLPSPQGINAEQLAAASFGSVMLQTVGRVYQQEADIYQGNPLLGGLGKLKRAGHSIR